MPEVKGRRITKKEAAVRQINAAIRHLYNEDYECAVTLAGAAEGMLPDTDEARYIFKELAGVETPPEFKDQRDWIAWLNAARDWLKHTTPHRGDEWNLTEMDVVIMVLRAVSTFQWTYHQSTLRFEDFYKWCHERGYPAPKREESV